MENNTGNAGTETNNAFGYLVAQYFEQMNKEEQERWALVVLIRSNRPDLKGFSDDGILKYYDYSMDLCFDAVKPGTQKILSDIDLKLESDDLLFRNYIDEIVMVSHDGILNKTINKLPKKLFKIVDRYRVFAIDEKCRRVKKACINTLNIPKTLVELEKAQIILDDNKELINDVINKLPKKNKSVYEVDEYNVIKLINMRDFCVKHLREKIDNEELLIKQDQLQASKGNKCNTDGSEKHTDGVEPLLSLKQISICAGLKFGKVKTLNEKYCIDLLKINGHTIGNLDNVKSDAKKFASETEYNEYFDFKVSNAERKTRVRNDIITDLNHVVNYFKSINEEEKLIEQARRQLKKLEKREFRIS